MTELIILLISVVILICVIEHLLRENRKLREQFYDRASQSAEAKMPTVYPKAGTDANGVYTDRDGKKYGSMNDGNGRIVINYNNPLRTPEEEDEYRQRTTERLVIR
jgi:cytochrome c biogenesis protein ResB